MGWIWKRLGRANERGAVLVVAVAGVLLATVAAALAVDLGRQAAEKRTNQKVVDLAALDGARALPGDPTSAVDASLTRNSFPYASPGYSRQVEVGYMDNGTFVPDATRPEAVRVTVRSPHKDQFLPGGRTVIARAVAKIGNQLGTVRVGSFLGNVNASTERILDRSITRLAGGNVDLTAVGWQGLANTSVTFQELRTALGMNAGSAEGVLNSSLTFGQLLQATVDALNADGSPSKAAVASELVPIANAALPADPSAHRSFKLGDLFSVVGNVGNGQDVADLAFNVMDIVRGGGILADQDRFLTFDMVAADVPGLTNCAGTCARVSIGLVEAPQQKSGPPKDSTGTYWTIAQTSQVRVLVEVNLIVALPIGLLGALVDTTVTVPFYFDAANAEAKLDTLECIGSSTPDKVKIMAWTSAATTSIGGIANASVTLGASTPPVLGQATLVNVAGVLTVRSDPVSTTVPGVTDQLLTFTGPYTETSPPQRIGKSVTDAITLPGLQTPGMTVTLALGVSVDANAVKLAVQSGVNQAIPSISADLVRSLYEAFGVSYAGADVWAPPVQTCAATSYTSPSPNSGSAIPTLVG